VRGSCVTCGGVEEAIAEEGRALRAARTGSQDRDGPARGVDENAAVDVGGTWWASRMRRARCTQCAYFARVWTVWKTYCSLRAPKTSARGLGEGAAGEASLYGGRGIAGAEVRRWRRAMRGNRQVDGDKMVERRMEATGL
jgi:hypothetical protein